MLNFNQFLNESKDNEFDDLEAGDKIQYAGTTCIIKKVGHGIIHLPDDKKVNRSQWNQRNGRLIEKANKEDEK
jgi:hypothetical protein